jgi:hypothetical protein
VSTIAKIKCQVLPIFNVLRLQYLFGVAEISTTLFSAQFFIFLITPMDPCYLYKLQLFILYLNKNIAKIRDMLMGDEKIRQTAIVFIGRFYLLLF